MSKIFFLSLLLLLVCHEPASAEPMLISFAEMMDQTQQIYLAQYLGPVHPAADLDLSYYLEVRKVIYGNSDHANQKVTVGRAHGSVKYDLNTGDWCIAFINKNGNFEWVGTVGEGKDLEKDLLYIRGFYDYNAYMVTPSAVDLGQIQEYIQDQKFTGKAEGYLHFFSKTTKQLEASKIHFSMDYQYPYEEGKSNFKAVGLDIVDFPKTPQVGMGGKIVYEPNLVRPLVIEGDVIAWNSKTKTKTYRYWVEEPEELLEEYFYQYLETPAFGPAYYKIKIETDQGENYTFVYHEEGGRIGYLESFGVKGKLKCWSLQEPNKEEKGEIKLGYYGDVIIELDKIDIPKDIPVTDRWVHGLLHTNYRGRILVKKGDVMEHFANCKLSIQEILFRKNVNYRGE